MITFSNARVINPETGSEAMGSVTIKNGLIVDVEDQGGGSTIQVEPKLKTAASSGSTVTYNSPQGLFRMDSNELMWDTNAVSVYGISFSCTEAD